MTTAFSIMAFLPELVLLAGALLLFVISLGESAAKQAKLASVGIAVAAIIACVASLDQEAVLFTSAYSVDAFSQWLKLVISCSFLFILLLSGDLVDIRSDIKAEYFLFLILSVIGFTLLVSSIELITLVVSLELSSFPLYMMVAMRRERDEQKTQVESAIKYIMFGVAANGVMLFGLSYLFGLTGTTSLPVMFEKLQPIVHTPLAIAGLSLAFAGVFYKLAVFPYHFWTPDVYQGASNETAGLIASLPKLGAVVVLVRFVSLASPDNPVLVTLLTTLAALSMFYGNLIALVQSDLKRLLGFSGIAHAGYALLGFVALDEAGFAASLYYVVGYVLMVLACFVVISRVSRDGTNVPIEQLAGLHKRSPILALTLVVGIFALAGIPPFVGFMAKLTLLTAALSKGHLVLVVIAVINTAIAAYYYLRVIREAFLRESKHDEHTPIPISFGTRVLCVLLVASITLLGILPAKVIDAISMSLAAINAPLP